MRRYLLVFGALMACLGATVGLAYVDLGPFNLVAALGIACLKAALVLLFFMQLLDSDGLAWIALGAGLTWVAILFGLTFSDYASRPSPRVPVTEIVGPLPGALGERPEPSTVK
jgi:cytochrome c oxidase subunit 4